MLLTTIHLLFMTYTVMLVIKIIGSWFPSFSQTKFMHFIAHYTDPYLNIFRKIIPPIGGVLDLSPLIGYIVLRVAESLITSFIIRFF